MHVLAVDRERAVLDLVRLSLSSDGHTVETCATGEEALERISESRFDVIVLDVALPGVSGAEVAASVRDEGNTTPIMMLSAITQEDHIIRAFEAGADCYAIKPVSAEEIVVRVRALFRRGQMAKNVVLSFEDLLLSQSDQTATRGDRPVDLTSTEFKLLAALMTDPIKAVSRAELMKRVRNSDSPSSTRILDAHMANLRRKLRALGPPLIETVHGYGYRMTSQSGG